MQREQQEQRVQTLSSASNSRGGTRGSASSLRSTCSGVEWHALETVAPHAEHCRMASARPERPSETHMRAERRALRSSDGSPQHGAALSSSGPSLRRSAPSSSATAVGRAVASPSDVSAAPPPLPLAGDLEGDLPVLGAGASRSKASR